MPSLKDPYLKVGRAKEHLDALKAAITSFAESKPYGLSAYDDLDSSEYVVTLTCDSPPLELALIAGDFFGCLRSSLDHLAWQLALLTTAPNFPKRVEFPVWGLHTAEAEGKISKYTAQIPAEAVEVIKSFQPYQKGPFYVHTHLWRLDRLWQVDKHRHITLRNGLIDTHFSEFKASQRFRTEQLDDGCMMRFPLSAKPSMPLNPTWYVDVSFGDEQEGIEIFTDGMLEMYEFVRDKVIPSFARFFPKPEELLKP